MDEVNLLDDGLVDVVLDSAASGLNTVEREGVSIIHPAKFIMLGSGNPMVSPHVAVYFTIYAPGYMHWEPHLAGMLVLMLLLSFQPLRSLQRQLSAWQADASTSSQSVLDGAARNTCLGGVYSSSITTHCWFDPSTSTCAFWSVVHHHSHFSTTGRSWVSCTHPYA